MHGSRVEREKRGREKKRSRESEKEKEKRREEGVWDESDAASRRKAAAVCLYFGTDRPRRIDGSGSAGPVALFAGSRRWRRLFSPAHSLAKCARMLAGLRRPGTTSLRIISEGAHTRLVRRTSFKTGNGSTKKTNFSDRYSRRLRTKARRGRARSRNPASLRGRPWDGWWANATFSKKTMRRNSVGSKRCPRRKS